MAGSLANLKLLARGGDDLYSRFQRLTDQMEKGIEQAARDAKINVLVQSVNGMLQFFFTRRKKIQNYRESLQIDWNLFLRHHQLLLDRGSTSTRITTSASRSRRRTERRTSRRSSRC